MREHRNPCPSPPPTAGQAVTLVRVESSLAVCVVCGHEESRASGRERVTCPDCGSTAWTVDHPADTEAAR
jgi:NADH pyrophosphatase NudC (nudix superfamily)